MWTRIGEDIRNVFARDPAARTVWEVLCCYPGLHAVWLHRLAHFLWRHRLFFLARLVSHVSRWLTGVEIHPGARVGRRLFIDHGMGVVIGETAEIGEDVLLYQGVVLGGTSGHKKKRHPTIGDRVIIGAGATVLGPISVGSGARVGAGSVVIKSVPEGATVVGVPGRIAGPRGMEGREADLEHAQLPDPVLRVLSEALNRQSLLEERVRQLESILSELPTPVPSPSAREPQTADESQVLELLRDVIEPEVGMNIVDLGLVRGVSLNGGGAQVRLALPHKDCPLASYMTEQVRRRVQRVVTGPIDVVIVDRVWSWADAAPALVGGDGI